MTEAIAYAYTSPTTGATRTTLERRATGPDDVNISIDYCGLCHSDIHTVRGEWGEIPYPMTPGHEIVGTVQEVGENVSDFSVGDRVGVGCIVDSCRECESCQDGFENYCEGTGMVGTYNGVDLRHDGEITQGGYSTSIVVDKRYVLSVPESLDPAAAAPLLCAGITTYSPLRHWGVRKGDAVGVIGLGGLGHMGVKLAKAMGATVTVFTTSESKVDAAKELGADRVVISKDENAMEEAQSSLNLILDTVAASHDLNPYLATLKRDGVLVQLGLPEDEMPPINPGLMIPRRRSYAGSMIGGIPATQDMLDFCAEHNITADVEVIKGDYLDQAYQRMMDSDVKYRFVLDLTEEK
ncbi:NAD(P)-dependent alcohol dehydrogenase [Haematomicrobium sanguinis]|uniref:NAD(P)-dependent alcohol dehydrogenase n=1 Tax=Haematomicrobium sanguinis TaxID=479106 RepID=UPI00055236E3|nr:NAD(P)-dependent alcohol dehydrogenase [Haematomicrobium sanguinis]